ncbi:MAG UNVERIFIED_CONTAM: hypothetical protein LVR18_51455 [Planctomycetaceae bacterium]
MQPPAGGSTCSTSGVARGRSHARDRIAALEQQSESDLHPTAAQLQLSASDDEWDT